MPEHISLSSHRNHGSDKNWDRATLPPENRDPKEAPQRNGDAHQANGENPNQNQARNTQNQARGQQHHKITENLPSQIIQAVKQRAASQKHSPELIEHCYNIIPPRDLLTAEKVQDDIIPPWLDLRGIMELISIYNSFQSIFTVILKNLEHSADNATSITRMVREEANTQNY